MPCLLLRRSASWCLVPLLGLGLLGAAEPPELLKQADGSCGSFGTSVEFVDTPSAAAQRARKEQKLVFVLHVSGNFEDPRFT